MVANPVMRTHTRLKALLPVTTPVVYKPGLNAFNNTNLHVLLQAAHIDAFVIMGYSADCCVRRTAVGGYEDRAETRWADGGTQNGYRVLTCPQVLRGGAVDWHQAPSVRFYTDL